MARKSRKNKIENDSVPPSSIPEYIAGAYLRISVEDDNSISNQEHIIRDYVKTEHDIRIHKFYIDNGVSSFVSNRPAFHKMIDDTKNKIINCIIVKDLSRFGRDFIETGIYVEKLFPIQGIRFISITDNYDSIDKAKISNLGMALKNILNTQYSEEISQKVKAVVKLKQERGEYIAAALPYGYKKQKINGATRYVIDEEAAHTVESIFNWAAEGDSGYMIAGRLNSLNILSPSDYKSENEDNVNVSHIWTRNAVVTILRNRVYIGCLVMGKTRTKALQLKKPTKVAKSEWIIAENHHEPIISNELFEKVREILDTRQNQVISERRNISPNAYIRDMLFCGYCGRKMRRRYWKGKTYYICSRRTEAKGACTSKSVNEVRLICEVFDVIQIAVEKALKYRDKQLKFEQSLAFRLKQKLLQERGTHLRSEIEMLKESKKLIYEALLSKSFSKTDYWLSKNSAGDRLSLLEQELNEITNELEYYQANVSSNSLWVRELIKYSDEAELTESMYKSLIEKIIVFDNKNKIMLKNYMKMTNLFNIF